MKITIQNSKKYGDIRTITVCSKENLRGFNVFVHWLDKYAYDISTNIFVVPLSTDVSECCSKALNLGLMVK